MATLSFNNYAPGSYYYGVQEDVPVTGVRWNGLGRPTIRVDLAVMRQDVRSTLNEKGIYFADDMDGWAEMSGDVHLNQMTLRTSQEVAGLQVSKNMFGLPVGDGYRHPLDISIQTEGGLHLYVSAYDMVHLCHLFPDSDAVCLEPLLFDARLIPRTYTVSMPSKGRNRWSRYANQIATLLKKPDEMASTGGRFLDLGPDINDMVAMFPASFIAPTLPAHADGTGSVMETPPAVFGMTEDWTSFKPYEPAPARYAHLAQYFRMDCWTTPWDKMFVHRGRDGWRTLACMFMRFPNANHRHEHAQPMLQYVVGSYFNHRDVSGGRVNIRGLPEGVTSVISQVPGMSLAMMQTMNTIRGLRRKLRLHEGLVALPSPLPAGHAVATVGLQWENPRSHHHSRALLTKHHETPWFVPGNSIPKLRYIAEAALSKGNAGLNMLVSDATAQEITALPVQPVASRPVRLFRKLSSLERQKSLDAERANAPVLRELDL